MQYVLLLPAILTCQHCTFYKGFGEIPLHQVAFGVQITGLVPHWPVLWFLHAIWLTKCTGFSSKFLISVQEIFCVSLCADFYQEHVRSKQSILTKVEMAFSKTEIQPQN